MKIYIAHSRNFNFKGELYEPIRQSSLNKQHTFVLPHELSDKPFKSRDYLKDEADLMIAEVSVPSTGLGIELGWASIFKVPIICIYRRGSRISNSLRMISEDFIEYSNGQELVIRIKKIINRLSKV